MAVAIRPDGTVVSGRLMTQQQFDAINYGSTTKNTSGITIGHMELGMQWPSHSWTPEEEDRLRVLFGDAMNGQFTRIFYNGKDITPMPARNAYRVTAVENGIEGKANTRQVVVIAPDAEKAKLYAQYILQPDPAANVLFTELLGPMPAYVEEK